MNDRRRGQQRGVVYWVLSIIGLLFVTYLPFLVILKLVAEFGAGMVMGYLGIVSLLTVAIYRSDKQKAKKESWRTPESYLHFLELIGGWGAAFLSQRLFRHKIKKRSYQVRFWLIALVHNFAALEYLNEFHYSILLLQSLSSS